MRPQLSFSSFLPFFCLTAYGCPSTILPRSWGICLREANLFSRSQSQVSTFSRSHKMSSIMGDVITISNFASRMTPLFADKSQLFALVDMGSNGIRFSISDLSPPRSRLLPCIYKERAGISLYDALHENTPGSKPLYFSQTAIEAVSARLAQFRRICQAFEVPLENIQVFATEAMRTAKNQETMLSTIYEHSGLKVDILAPETESLFGSLGARSGFEHVQGLFMDLGGGSVQMTWLDSSIEGYEVLAAQAAQSLPYGAARLSEALKVQDAPATMQTLKAAMRETFEGMMRKFTALKEKVDGEGVRIYFCGGGFRGYGSMLMHTHPVQPYPIPSIGGFEASGEHFKPYKEMLAANSQEGKVFGLSKRRREQFPAIAAVIESLVEAIPQIRDVVFCSGGNREGVLYMKLPREIRESNPLDLLAATDPGIATSQSTGHLEKTFRDLLPMQLPRSFSDPILTYFFKSAYTYQGLGDDSNSAYSLHHSISGSISDLPGLTHELRALIALTLLARWNADLGPMDQHLQKQLQLLVGEAMTWWCQYVGAALRFVATLYPSSGFKVDDFASFRVNWVDTGLGKKGKKAGITIEVIGEELPNLDAALDCFQKVGKGLEVDWKVETGAD